jgi:lysophospholipase L1-like esterase
LDAVLEKKPAAIFLLIGANDVFQGIHPALTTANHAVIIDRILSESPTTFLVVATIFPVGADLSKYFDTVPADSQQRIDSLNLALVALCQQKQIPMLTVGQTDMRTPKGYMVPVMTEPDPVTPPFSGGDQVHLGPVGYSVWCAALWPFLQAFQSPASPPAGAAP